MIRPGPIEVLLLYIVLFGGVAVFVVWLVKRAARKSARDELKKYHQELHEQEKTITEDK